MTNASAKRIARAAGRQSPGISDSAFRSQLPATQAVEVEVIDGHAGGGADVEGEAVAAFVDAFVFGDFGGGGEHAGDEGAMLAFDVAGVGDVLFGEDHEVDGGARVDVEDGDDEVVFVEAVGFDFAGDDAAEDAVVRHGGIIRGVA